MTIIRCDVRDCAYQGREVCKADRIKLESGECLTYCPYAELMKQRSEIDTEKCRKGSKKW